MSENASDQPTAGDSLMHSFGGRALEGADFSGKDLRGADFTGANLRSASFREAKVEVAPRVGAVILGIGILIAMGTGMVIGWSVDEIRNETTAEEWDRVATGGSLGLILLVLLGLIFWKGFDVAIKAIVIFYLVVVAINIAANLIWEEIEWLSLLRATALIVFVTLLHLVHRLIRRWGTQFVDADLIGADFTGTNAMRCDTRRATVTNVTWDPKYPRPVDLPETEPST